jgi:hypothetical protein
MAEEGEKPTCGTCRRSGAFSAPVSVMLVFSDGLPRPFPLIPAEDYSVCTRCEAVFGLIDRAVASHAATKAAGPWTRAIVVFSDGQGLDVVPPQAARATQKMALA